ncbi:hypothetical protein B7Z28_01065 [Candidatus Saccharibacteria bacterium 32-45-3]|nr:MAG: hypothetical protein B7Z28_01065 [Candidatus Saccharibacteria bacterium 32-45-3]
MNNPSAFTLNSAGWESDGDATNKSGGFIRSLPSSSFNLGQLAIMVVDGSVGNITFPLNETPAGWTIDRTSSPVASAHIAATEDSTTVSSDLQLSGSGYVAGGILVLGE